MNATEPLEIGVLVFDGVEELDAVGPWEILAFWAHNVATRDIRVRTISADGGPVRCMHGLRIAPDVDARDAGRLDVLVYPGGPGARERVSDPAHHAWVREQRAAVPLMTSVCTGSLVYAAAGLAAGRRVTTHWRALDALAELEPTATVDREARFVDDGDLVTSAGISAGIDMALHLVERLGDAAQAASVRRGVQYDTR